MKPAAGTYRLSTPGPNGTTLSWDVRVDENGAVGPFSEEFAWAPGDILVSSTRNLTLECNGTTPPTGTATFGTPTQTIQFSCAKIA